MPGKESEEVEHRCSYDPNELQEDSLDSVLFEIESAIRQATTAVDGRDFEAIFWALAKALRAAATGADTTELKLSVVKLLDSELLTLLYWGQLVEMIRRCAEELRDEKGLI